MTFYIQNQFVIIVIVVPASQKTFNEQGKNIWLKLNMILFARIEWELGFLEASFTFECLHDFRHITVN